MQKKSLLFIALLFTVLFSSCEDKKKTDVDTTKFVATEYKIDTTETSPNGYAAPPPRAGKEARKMWDNVFKNCNMFSEMSKYGEFLGVGSVQSIGQILLKEDYQEMQNGASFNSNWFDSDENAINSIFPRGESNTENIDSCKGKTGRKVSLNTLLGGNVTLPQTLNSTLSTQLQAAFEKKTEQTVEVKWRRKEINVLNLPAYMKIKADEYDKTSDKKLLTAKIYYDNLFKDNIIVMTKGIIVESFKTKINIDALTEAGLKAAFKKDSTLSLNGDFKLNINSNSEFFLENNKPFVLRGAFYNFKKK